MRPPLPCRIRVRFRFMGHMPSILHPWPMLVPTSKVSLPNSIHGIIQWGRAGISFRKAVHSSQDISMLHHKIRSLHSVTFYRILPLPSPPSLLVSLPQNIHSLCKNRRVNDTVSSGFCCESHSPVPLQAFSASVIINPGVFSWVQSAQKSRQKSTHLNLPHVTQEMPRLPTRACTCKRYCEVQFWKFILGL